MDTPSAQNPGRQRQKIKIIIEKTGWYLTFALVPCGQPYFGLLFLLIAKLASLFSREKQEPILSSVPRLAKRTGQLFVFLLVYMFINSFFSKQPLNSFLLSLAFTLVFYFYFFGSQRLAFYDRKFLTTCFFLFTGGGIAVSAATLIRYFSLNLPRAELFGGPNSLGTLIIMYTGVGLGFLLAKGKPYAYFVFPFLTASVCALLATQSRGAWVGFAGMLVLLMLLNYKKKITLIFLVILLLAAGLLMINPTLNDRFLSIFSLDKGGNMTRIHIWQASLNMIKDKPLQGVGLGVFPAVYLEYAPPAAKKEKTFAFAHNIFLQMAAELGLPGFLLFSLAFAHTYFLAYKLTKSGNPFYQGIFASLVGVFIHQQVDLPIWKTNIGIGFWLLLGLAVGLYAMEAKKTAVTTGPSQPDCQSLTMPGQS
ncbi:O-antigen ligase family protein [Capillibacterium thermochitinicola]|uniref:O-antigen ligase family protein n=1 Tax=Capillibacterium thermochitinicola TaxID=2699427 RepID=A0A8J6LJB9_9FIRM|nr:O-antigen ligase family protein [Capillibacterium thermochitinicola]MBA2133681.1 O-antigen ligase family protein [Capillibacterium thermochitinicola]